MSSESRREDNRSNQIGRKGHRAIADLLDDHGLLASDLSVDKGEDVVTQIYEEGNFTGLSFYGQFKAAEAAKVQGESVKFQIETKHLDRWSSHCLPIFLFIYCIATQRCFWVEIDDELIEKIEEKTRAWRSQKTVTLEIPVTNLLDREGAEQIRNAVKKATAPIYASNKTLRINLELDIPNTDEGQEVRQRIQDHLDTGNHVEIPSKFIKEFRTSSWWNRLNGHPPALPPGSILKLSSQPSVAAKPFELRMNGMDRKFVAAINVQLQIIQSGQLEVTYSNVSNPSPLLIKLVFRNEGGQTKYTLDFDVKGSRTKLQEYKSTLNFLDALHKGGELRLSEKNQKSPLSQKNFKFEIEPHKFPLVSEISLDELEKCHRIQSSFGVELQLSDLYITKQESKDLEDIMTILDFGYIRKTYESLPLTVKLKSNSANTKSAVEMSRALLNGEYESIENSIVAEVGEATLFFMNTPLNLGPSKNYISGHLTPENRKALQEVVDTQKELTELEIVFERATLISQYYDWNPEPLDTIA